MTRQTCPTDAVFFGALPSVRLAASFVNNRCRGGRRRSRGGKERATTGRRGGEGRGRERETGGGGSHRDPLEEELRGFCSPACVRVAEQQQHKRSGVPRPRASVQPGAGERTMRSVDRPSTSECGCRTRRMERRSSAWCHSGEGVITVDSSVVSTDRGARNERCIVRLICSPHSTGVSSALGLISRMKMIESLLLFVRFKCEF